MSIVLGGGKEALSGRRSTGAPAAAYLVADDDLRVFGDLWSSVSITGVPSWVADVLRCIIVEGDDPFDYRAIGELLLGLSDDEIVETLSAIGSIPARARAEAPEALAIVETRAKIAREQKLSADTSAVSTTPATHDGATFVPDVVVERLATLRDKTDDAQRIWAELIQTPLPEEPALHAAVVERWLAASPKPRIDCKVGEVNSEWPVLTWLLGSGEQTRALLETLAREHSEQATDFVEAVMKRGDTTACSTPSSNGQIIACIIIIIILL